MPIAETLLIFFPQLAHDIEEIGLPIQINLCIVNIKIKMTKLYK